MHLSDGSAYEVRHPEMAWVTLRTVAIGIEADEDDLPARAVYADPRHITRLEPLNGGG